MFGICTPFCLHYKEWFSGVLFWSMCMVYCRCSEGLFSWNIMCLFEIVGLVVQIWNYIRFTKMG